MPVAEGFVVDEQAVVGVREDGDTAEVRTTIDAAHGCERLEQRVLRFAPGRSLERSNDDRQEVLYVARGRGTLHLEGREYELEPESGVFIAPGETYTVDDAGPGELLVISVTAPESELGVGANRRVLVRYAEQPALPASPNREFRYLVNQDAGCLDMTQFVGVIPPSRAPLHSHTYDEVVFILEGDGVYHIGEDEIPMGPGTCIHLPPLVLHCLENTGTTDMRVLGVFHPSGDPASRAKIEAQVDNKEGM
jgi:mannose-6-phosphate isomerase-like protein (cupin superfamily)